MSSPQVAESIPSGAMTDRGDVVAFYICAGHRTMPGNLTVFPDGGTFEVTESCPAREICAWHASHDLGGEFSFNEQAEGRFLPVQFKSGPFSCPNFRDFEALLKTRNHGARCRCGCGRRRTPGAVAAVAAT